MVVTITDEHRHTTDAVICVRVPEGSDADLTTEAQRRLARADGVAAVTVDGMQALDSGLSATVVTVAVTIERHGGQASPPLADALVDEVVSLVDA